ncbi:MAG: hypothetical protein A2700_02130 [Candidatus Blackburnbacteria bacterium RIFCSPHIGHO2_01_FULL_44_64]|uniref:Ribosome-binding ATPase YchF n=1 Tax=Candidatus Blackburnbacteria bacterium RIFCSPHIGHO2_02_FULL_44_20 TaxID=1797516 RepID=A0A1G1V7N9_9BACT|nr:MAG: hypothetical protein A2700_02130 [Candidatus Blackburnbacteria bacterium RIFCSPHIGHO2_01_FULL_44_64]OGY11201.1 MAG: hypothetical protein A3E16_00360 [Candidatus Blackburnbacteria bacterium RIFCSPHIGHO2_12_FULL_44_25]OGY11488.1 MAG: hypothetical protein A3D26_04670 [Candidatus Blackburnbacteria bacterium RIFCSPHIGHO2_02_FULL_44_20]OGY15171.1 MAG: hypothetical protein A3A62_01425 [Candidatus Blackburnbacteria bacterium RIFCSPLOWO2_01_FULL_44_43]OGY17555.1 MAG: hypothetical protein A3H88_0
MKVGIVGLPNVGKSTLFNALLKKQQAYVANFPFATIEPNVGIVPVPDSRLDKLADVVEAEGLSPSASLRISRPPVVPSVVQFVDIAGLVAGASKGEGLGNKFLAHIREVDAIVHVVRDFSDPDIIRAGSVDPKSDLEIVRMELELADLDTLERSKNKKSEVDRSLPLFGKKPILVVLNVDEEELTSADARAEEFATLTGLSKDQVVVVSAKVESELAGLSVEDEREYLAQLGIKESGLERLIKKAFATLGLITFLTAGEKEVRAWTIRRGETALRASGVIHTDFMSKFIKAEIVGFEDFIEAGGWKKSRELGKARLEGKEYVIKDGDVVEFKIGA